MFVPHSCQLKQFPSAICRIAEYRRPPRIPGTLRRSSTDSLLKPIVAGLELECRREPYAALRIAAPLAVRGGASCPWN